MNKLMTIDEVAELFQVSDKTVSNLAKEKKLPSVKIGRSVRFKVEDVNKFIEDCSDSTDENIQAQEELQNLIRKDLSETPFRFTKHKDLTLGLTSNQDRVAIRTQFRNSKWGAVSLDTGFEIYLQGENNIFNMLSALENITQELKDRYFTLSGKNWDQKALELGFKRDHLDSLEFRQDLRKILDRIEKKILMYASYKDYDLEALHEGEGQPLNFFYYNENIVREVINFLKGVPTAPVDNLRQIKVKESDNDLEFKDLVIGKPVPNSEAAIAAVETQRDNCPNDRFVREDTLRVFKNNYDFYSQVKSYSGLTGKKEFDPEAKVWPLNNGRSDGPGRMDIKEFAKSKPQLFDYLCDFLAGNSDKLKDIEKFHIEMGFDIPEPKNKTLKRPSGNDIIKEMEDLVRQGQ